MCCLMNSVLIHLHDFLTALPRQEFHASAASPRFREKLKTASPTSPVSNKTQQSCPHPFKSTITSLVPIHLVRSHTFSLPMIIVAIHNTNSRSSNVNSTEHERVARGNLRCDTWPLLAVIWDGCAAES